MTFLFQLSHRHFASPLCQSYTEMLSISGINDTLSAIAAQSAGRPARVPNTPPKVEKELRRILEPVSYGSTAVPATEEILPYQALLLLIGTTTSDRLRYRYGGYNKVRLA